MEGLLALARLAPVVKGWRLSVAERFDRSFGDDEAAKYALAANLGYYHDDPATLSWILFAGGQGAYLGSGGRYIRDGSQRLSNALARALKSAGGEILLGRAVTKISIDLEGRPSGVTHERPEGGEPAEVRAPIVISNAAPAVVVNMLPPSARERFWAPYAGRRLSISLFSATFGLSTRPAELGLKSYSTFLLPKWVTRFADYRRFGEVMAGMPGDAAPPIAIVDYSAIDSGLGGPPYPVTVAGVDRTQNWSSLDRTAYDAKRDRWREAILGAIDCEFPGFAANVVASFSGLYLASTYASVPTSQLATNNSCSLDFVQSRAGAADFFEDSLSFRRPFIRLGIGVALGEIGVDVVDQLLHRGEAARADHILGQIGEEPFDQIEPR